MGRPKGGEKGEKGYYAEISLTRSEDPYASYTSPLLQETFFSLCDDVHLLLVISWSKSWKEFVKGLRLDESGGRFHLESAKGRLR